MSLSDRALRLHRDSIIIDPCVQYLLRRTDSTDSSGLTDVALTIQMPNENTEETYPNKRNIQQEKHKKTT